MKPRRLPRTTTFRSLNMMTVQVASLWTGRRLKLQEYAYYLFLFNCEAPICHCGGGGDDDVSPTH